MPRKIKINAIMVAHPPKNFNWRGKLPTVEETGKGDLLCYEAYGGRLFRCSEEAVREAVEKFIDDYATGCLRSAEDPAHLYVEVYNWNDLYYLIGILPTHFGDAQGYSTDPDHAIDGIRMRIEMAYPSNHYIAEKFGEPVLIIEPEDEFSYPDFYYREY